MIPTARTVLAAAMALGGLVGCAPSSEACPEGNCPCDDALIVGGVCCVGFLELGDDGCRARAWPTEAVPLSPPGASDVEVAVGGSGDAVVGWVQVEGSPPTTRSTVAEETATGWNTIPLGSPDDGFGVRVTLAAGVGRQAIATWTQYATSGSRAGQSATFLATRDAEGTWTLPDPGASLSFPTRAYEPRPLITPQGESFVVWNQWGRVGYGVALAHQAPDEPFGTFELPNDADDVLSPPVFFSNAPQIAIGQNGDGVITWYQSPGEGKGLHLFVSERRGARGTFSRPRATATLSPSGPPIAGHEVRNPIVQVGAFGDALLVWSQEHPSGRTGLYMAQRDGFGVWTPPRDIDDTFAPLREHAACAELAIGLDQEAFVVWHDGNDGNTRVYGAHRDVSGRWDAAPPADELLSTPGARASHPRLAVGPAGEAILTWSESVAGVWQVVARRRNARSTAWGEPVVLSDRHQGDAIRPAVAIGSGGRVAIAWSQGPSSARRAFVTMMD